MNSEEAGPITQHCCCMRMEAASLIQGSQSEPLRRVRVAWAGDFPAELSKPQSNSAEKRNTFCRLSLFPWRPADHNPPICSNCQSARSAKPEVPGSQSEPLRYLQRGISPCVRSESEEHLHLPLLPNRPTPLLRKLSSPVMMITEKNRLSRLAVRAAAPRAGCLKGNTFHSARVCII